MVTNLFLTMVAYAGPFIIGAGLNGNCVSTGSSFDTDGGASPNTRFLVGGTTYSN